MCTERSWEGDMETGSLIIKRPHMRLTNTVCLIRNMMMKRVGLKLRRIDSSSGSAQTARRRDRQEGGRWKVEKDDCDEVEKAEC